MRKCIVLSAVLLAAAIDDRRGIARVQ